MIIIYDTVDSERAYRLRNIFLKSGIPCAYKSTAEDDHSSKTLINILFMERTGSNSSEIKTLDPEALLLCDGTAEHESAEFDRVYNRALDILDVKYGINPDSYFSDSYSDVCGIQRFYGKTIHFTEKERLIIKHLTIGKASWSSAEEIVGYCFDHNCKIHLPSTHINNINDKTVNCTGRRIIETSRRFGYRYLGTSKK